MTEKKRVIDSVMTLVKPYADSLGLELWDVKLVKEGDSLILRLIIDKEGGVTMDDCVNLSHAVDEPLDELDPIDESYSLQVSSPGIERKLERDWHFKKYIGSKVMFKLPKAVNGKKNFKGTLIDYDNGIITIDAGEDGVMNLDKKLVSYVKLDDFEGFGND